MIKTTNLSHFTSIGIGPIVDIFMIQKDEIYPKKHTILGHGSNILVSNNANDLMMLSKDFDYIRIENNTLIIGAATVSGKIVSFCKKHNIANFEFLLKLPGNLGGMVKMNAGLKEFEIFNHLVAIKTTQGYIKKANISHSYRHTLIQDVIFEGHFSIETGFDNNKVEMFQKMRDNQPTGKSAGSCFINPPNNFAAKLIQDVGLKGFFIGDMGFSSKHANFLINKGNGTYDDAIEVITLAQKKVLEQFDIQLELEIVLI